MTGQSEIHVDNLQKRIQTLNPLLIDHFLETQSRDIRPTGFNQLIQSCLRFDLDEYMYKCNIVVLACSFVLWTQWGTWQQSSSLCIMRDNRTANKYKSMYKLYIEVKMSFTYLKEQKQPLLLMFELLLFDFNLNLSY